MSTNHMMLFYVSDPVASAAFYGRVLEAPPVDVSPGFAMFKLNDGTMLGLWNSKGVQPKATAAAGASELAFHVPSDADVDAFHHRLKQDAVEIVQSPTKMDFGYTFTAIDPDGHRLRVFAGG